MCGELGWQGLDRQRIANLEAGRGRGITLEEFYVLCVALEEWPTNLMNGGGAPSGLADADDEAWEAWMSAPLRLTSQIGLPRGSIDFWWEGSWRPGQPPVHAGPPPREPTRNETMELLRRLAAEHGLRVIFELDDRG